MPEVSPNPIIDLNNAREQAWLEATLARIIERRFGPSDVHREIEEMFDGLSAHGGCLYYADDFPPVESK